MGGIGAGLKSLGMGMVAGLGVEAVTGAIGSALEYASSLGEVAQQLGVTTSDLQRYRYIASQVGIEQQEMDKGLSTLTRTLGQLAAGAKAPADALRRLGFDQQQIATISRMTAGDAIPVLADAFAKLKSPTEQAALAAELFGSKLGPKFQTLLNGGRTQIDELTGAYKKLGIEISESQIKKADEAMDKWAEYKKVLEAWAVTIGVGLMDGLTAFNEFMDRWAANVHANMQSLKAAPGEVAAAFTGMANVAVGAAQRLYQGVRTWIVDKLNAVWNAAVAGLQKVGDKAKWLWDVTVGHSYIPDMVDAIGQHMARLDALMVAPAEAAANKTAEAFRTMAQDTRDLLANLFPEAEAKLNFQKTLDRINASQRAGEAGGGMTAEMARAARHAAVWRENARNPGTITPIGDRTEEFEREADDLTDAVSELGGNVRLRGKELAMSLAGAAQGLAGAVQNMFSSLRGGSAGDKISGVLNFIQMAVQTYSQFKGGGGGFNFGGFRAAGGPVVPGKSYVVGERGPEWFTPRGRGFVTPSNNNASRGVTVHQHFSPNFAGNAVTREDLMLMGRITKAETISAFRDMQRRRG